MAKKALGLLSIVVILSAGAGFLYFKDDSSLSVVVTPSEQNADMNSTFSNSEPMRSETQTEALKAITPPQVEPQLEEGLIEVDPIPDTIEPIVASEPAVTIDYKVADSLSNSDATFLAIASELNAKASQWLDVPDQVRKWVLLVNLGAVGNIPYKNRPFELKLGSVTVKEQNGVHYLLPENAQRYDEFVEILTAIPVDTLVGYFRTWLPLLNEAYRELGIPGTIEDKAVQMIDNILAVQQRDLPIRLKVPEQGANYQFYDQSLEAASQLEKWLWRMGPAHAAKVQQLARDIKQELDRGRSMYSLVEDATTSNAREIEYGLQ